MTQDERNLVEQALAILDDAWNNADDDEDTQEKINTAMCLLEEALDSEDTV